MKAVYLLFVAVGVAMTGCAIAPTPSRRETYVRPGLIMLTADQAERRGIYLRGDEAPTGLAVPGDTEASNGSGTRREWSTAGDAARRLAEPNDASTKGESPGVPPPEASRPHRGRAKSERPDLAGASREDAISPLLAQEVVPHLIEQRKATQANERAIAALFEAFEALNRQQKSLAERKSMSPPKAQAKRPSPAVAAAEPTVEPSESHPEER